jgi:hypothetical protein
MTQDEKDYICEQIAAGRALTEMIEKNEIAVESRTIYREMARDPVFMANYARAREISIEVKMSETEDIILGRGEFKDIEFERAKELVNDRRWFAIRLQRFRYGDKIDVDVNAKMQIEGTVIDADALDVDQLMAVRDALQLTDQSVEDAEYEEVEDE